MTGLFRTMRVGPIGPGPVSPTAYLDPAAIAFRSKPAQNVPAAPVSTPTASLSSSSKREKLAARAAAVSGSTALRTSGPVDGDGQHRPIDLDPYFLRSRLARGRLP